MTWRDRQLPSGELPLQTVMQEVLWELFELNFHFEFVGLDSRCSNMNDTLECRQCLIMACFTGRHGRSLLVVDLEAGERELVAVSWEARVPYLLAMLQVMKSWSECPSSLADAAGKGVEVLSEKDMVMLEREMSKFYTQSFFNHFARAAIVPHRLIRGNP